jgi:hypothetical protein
MLKNIKIYIYNYLLKQVNKNENDIKNSILKKYGEFLYNELETIPGKQCNNCNGEKETWNKNDFGQYIFGTCRTCGGTNYIVEPIYNVIAVYKLKDNEFRFINKTYNNIEHMKDTITGKMYRKTNIKIKETFFNKIKTNIIYFLLSL